MALKIVWTPQALKGLKRVLQYLDAEWSKKEILNLEVKLYAVLDQISKQPQLFPKTGNFKNIHKAVIDKNNYIIYRNNNSKRKIEIINFRGTKQKPLKGY